MDLGDTVVVATISASVRSGIADEHDSAVAHQQHLLDGIRDGAPEGPVVRVGVKAVAEAVSVEPQVRHPLGSRLREVVVVLATTNEGAVVQEEDVVEDVGAGGPVLGPEPVAAEARVQVSVGSRRGRRDGQGRRQHAHCCTCPEPPAAASLVVSHSFLQHYSISFPSPMAKPTWIERATSVANSSSV